MCFVRENIMLYSGFVSPAVADTGKSIFTLKTFPYIFRLKQQTLMLSLGFALTDQQKECVWATSLQSLDIQRLKLLHNS